jgi:hypothetical protein
MRILFDQGVPRGLAASLPIHEVTDRRPLLAIIPEYRTVYSEIAVS